MSTAPPGSAPGDQEGRTAVVTGANSGVGFETARALALAGARVLLSVRDPARGEQARQRILAERPGAAVEVSVLDLASLASVRAFADRAAALGRVDVLVNNAGVMATPEQRTEDGFELQLGVALFGHFVLTARLWPLLAAAAGSRVVSVTSLVRLTGVHLDPADPLLRDYDPWRAYGRSKLAVAVFGLELHRRARAAEARSGLAPGTLPASLVAHPGFSNTNLQAATAAAQDGAAARFFAWSVRGVGMSAREGAASQIRAATDPAARSGELWAPLLVSHGPAGRRAVDARSASLAAGAVLWDMAEEQTGERFDVGPRRA